MGRLPNIKYRKLAHVLIISDTTCSEKLNLKARHRSNRPSLKRVKIAKVHQLTVISFDTQHCLREIPFVYLPGREIESVLSRT